jgi:hypothetical protein
VLENVRTEREFTLGSLPKVAKPRRSSRTLSSRMPEQRVPGTPKEPASRNQILSGINQLPGGKAYLQGIGVPAPKDGKFDYSDPWKYISTDEDLAQAYKQGICLRWDGCRYKGTPLTEDPLTYECPVAQMSPTAMDYNHLSFYNHRENQLREFMSFEMKTPGPLEDARNYALLLYMPMDHEYNWEADHSAGVPLDWVPTSDNRLVALLQVGGGTHLFGFRAYWDPNPYAPTPYPANHIRGGFYSLCVQAI